VNATGAGRILDRLSGHWPSLIGSDGAADDWLRAIRLSTHAEEAADLLVAGWNRDRNPKIADWQETCRQIARRRELEAGPKAIEAPRARDIGLAGVARAKAELAKHRGTRSGRYTGGRK
jgi:hypothetical protein